MSEAALRDLARVRGATTALEARDYLAQVAQRRLDAIDIRARSLLAEGRLTGEVALAMWAERTSLVTLFAELDGQIAEGRRAASRVIAPPGT